jgi:hypothetical protein
MRSKVALSIRTILDDEQVEVFHESRQTFLDGLTLYESRSDKGYSLTDCIAMNVMRKRGITEVLTHDSFQSRGFSHLAVEVGESHGVLAWTVGYQGNIRSAKVSQRKRVSKNVLRKIHIIHFCPVSCRS